MSLTKSQADDYEAYAGNPETWALAARRSLAVAEVLFSRFTSLSAVPDRPFYEYSGCFYASYFHAGVAMENAAKAVLVHRDPSIVSGGTLNKSKFGGTSHALVELFRLVHMPLTDQEHRLVVKLEQYVVWAGKYTIPLKAPVLYDQSLKDTMRLSAPNELDVIRSLINRLLEHVPTGQSLGA